MWTRWGWTQDGPVSSSPCTAGGGASWREPCWFITRELSCPSVEQLLCRAATPFCRVYSIIFSFFSKNLVIWHSFMCSQQRPVSGGRTFPREASLSSLVTREAQCDCRLSRHVASCSNTGVLGCECQTRSCVPSVTCTCCVFDKNVWLGKMWKITKPVGLPLPEIYRTAACDWLPAGFCWGVPWRPWQFRHLVSVLGDILFLRCFSWLRGAVSVTVISAQKFFSQIPSSY